MSECGVPPERTVLVGDSSVDIRTARNAGVMSIGVTYGFQPESLADPPPDLVMDRMEDVAAWIVARHNGITNES
jgi:phosphoglycolate phosphatase